MGEFAVQNVDPRLGSLRWADWTNRASNLPLVRFQGTVLVPIQEMRPFQRQVREADIATSLSPGQRARFEATVPIDEAWKILDVTMEHDDSVDHEILWSYNPRRGAGGNHIVSRGPIPVGIQTPIYRSFTAFVSSGTFAPRGAEAVEFFPDDDISFFSLAVAVDPTVIWRFRIRYELIPLPLEQDVTTEWTSQAI